MTTTAFVGLAERAAQAFGVSRLRRVVLPHPVNALSHEELAALREGAVAEIVRGLTEEVP